MRLYHGSTVEVRSPLVNRSRPQLDFGRGFYLTSYIEQATQWAMRKASFDGSVGVVNEYECRDDLSGLRVARYDKPDERWVDFVCACRRGSDEYKRYDVIVGGVADDKVYFAVDMYLRGLWDIATTLEALKYYNVNDQWCFVCQEVLDECVSFVRSWRVDGNKRHE